MKSLKYPLLALAVAAMIGLALSFGVNAYIQLLVLFVIVNSILAMSLNLVNGITGQFSLGHTGFMAVGAYFSSYAAIHFQLFQGSLEFLNYIYTFLGAGALAAFAGYLVGQPSLRLRGDYLAIVTLGFGEIIGVTTRGI
jgi:branched-chain amino acid transport system permease protein